MVVGARARPRVLRKSRSEVVPRGAGEVRPRMTRLLSRLFALILGSVLIALACTPENVPPQAQMQSDAPRGGTLRVAWWNEPSGLFPYVAAQLPARILSHFVVEGLVAVSPDAEYQPWLAKEVPTVANGAVTVLPGGKMDVTFRLLPDVTWSDGQPFTSSDVKF